MACPIGVAYSRRHHDDVTARYHPIVDTLWDDEALEGMTFEGHAFFCFLCSNRRLRPSGIYRATEEQLAVDTGLPRKRVAEYLGVLVARHRIVRDGAWIFVRGYFARQPKQERLLEGVRQDIADCGSNLVLDSFGEKYPLYRKWSNDRLTTVSCRDASSVSTEQSNTEQSNTEQSNEGAPSGKEPESDIPPKLLERIPDLAKWPSPEALVALWNDAATRWNDQGQDAAKLPVVETLSAGRRDKARRAIAQFPDWRWWNHALSHIRQSPFLTGRIAPTNGHGRAFRADFDWLLAKHKDGTENVVKLHDGRYDG